MCNHNEANVIAIYGQVHSKATNLDEGSLILG